MMNQSRGQIARFIAAGVLNTLFGWLIYSTTILLGAQPWFALIIGIVFGIAFNFVTLGGYVFRNLVKEKIPKFVAAYACIYLINLVLLRLLKPWVESAIWGQLILSLPIAVVSYLLQSKFVFGTENNSK
jgi:putative flippase GtrA